MSALAHLGLALGLATLAGFNLYLTVFMVGLAARLEWLPLPDCAALEAFSSPAVMGVALVLFLVEFLIDKVPWADSLWDSIHTFLRPAGGALLALNSLPPDASTLSHTGIALLAIAATLLSHSTKAGFRLRLNTSPEPFSNVGASVAEDLLVVGGFWLALNHPVPAAGVFITILVVFGLLAPRLLRSSRAILWLIWKKLRMPSDPKAHGKAKFSTSLSAEESMAIGEHFPAGEFDTQFAQFCVTGKVRGATGLAPNLRGTLVAARGKPGYLYFVRKAGLRGRSAIEIDVRDAVASHESRFLSETLQITRKSKKVLLNFHLHRGQHSLVNAMAHKLQLAGAPDDEGSEEPRQEDQAPPEPARKEAPAEEIADASGQDEPGTPLEIPDTADGSPGIGILLGGAEKKPAEDEETGADPDGESGSPRR